MGALANGNELMACVAGRRQHSAIFRSQAFTTVAGQYTSHWTGGGFPGPGAFPAATSVPTNATPGSLFQFTNPAGGEFAYLLSFDAAYSLRLNGDTSVTPASTFMFDRLVHVGGLSGTVASPTVNTVNTSALTRGDTTGNGVMGFIECYEQLGVTGTTATISYTSSAGVSGQITTVAIPSNFRAGRLLLIPLLSGDVGIRSIESVTLAVSTGTAGNYGVTLARRITALETRLTSEPKRRAVLDQLSRIETNACLWLVTMATGSVTASVTGGLTIITTGASPTNESTSFAAIATLLTSRVETIDVVKVNNISISLAGSLQSNWGGPGTGGTGVTPGAGAAPTSATPGAMFQFTNPSVGHFAHIYAIDMASVITGPIYFYDRLSHMGGLSGTSVALQAVGTAALTRGDTSGFGVEAFLECYTQLGGVSVTANIAYTNSAGVGKTTSVVIPGTMRAGRLLQIPLAEGDLGVRSVDSVTLLASTTAVGNFGFTLARRITMLPTVGSAVAVPEPQGLVGLEVEYPTIEPDACLWAVTLSITGGASNPPITGAVTILTTG